SLSAGRDAEWPVPAQRRELRSAGAGRARRGRGVRRGRRSRGRSDHGPRPQRPHRPDSAGLDPAARAARDHRRRRPGAAAPPARLRRIAGRRTGSWRVAGPPITYQLLVDRPAWRRKTMRKTTRLRELFYRPEILVLPGTSNALQARMVEAAGF